MCQMSHWQICWTVGSSSAAVDQKKAKALHTAMLTHNARSTRGASLLLLCRDSADHSGMSGIPVQNLKRKANATPKYRCLGTHTVTRTRIGVTYPEQVRRLPEQMLRSQVIDTKYLIQGTGCQIPGSASAYHLVPGTRYQVPGTWDLVPGALYRVPGTCYLVPGTWS